MKHLYSSALGANVTISGWIRSKNKKQMHYLFMENTKKGLNDGRIQMWKSKVRTASCVLSVISEGLLLFINQLGNPEFILKTYT